MLSACVARTRSNPFAIAILRKGGEGKPSASPARIDNTRLPCQRDPARRDIEEEEREEQQASDGTSRRRHVPWVACFLVVFAAEWGDLTQLATAALVAQTGQPLQVGVGALLALWAVTVLAAVAGAQLGRLVRPSLVKWASVVLFAAVGLLVLASSVPLSG